MSYEFHYFKVDSFLKKKLVHLCRNFDFKKYLIIIIIYIFRTHNSTIDRYLLYKIKTS